MPVVRKSISDLRKDLAKLFPTAQRTPGRLLRTGIPAIDEPAGGLPLAAVTEIVCAAPSSGGHLLLGQLLTLTRAASQRVALIDSTDSFDPGSYPEDLFAHLLWVRCTGTAMALQAADLLARDANLGLVVLDLRRAPEADLRKIPGPQWYRLQRAVEPTDLALVIETPRASVPSAQLRLALNTSHLWGALTHERSHLTVDLAPTLSRQRVQAAAAG
jgi:hypothetical protein